MQGLRAAPWPAAKPRKESDTATVLPSFASRCRATQARKSDATKYHSILGVDGPQAAGHARTSIARGRGRKGPSLLGCGRSTRKDDTTWCGGTTPIGAAKH